MASLRDDEKWDRQLIQTTNSTLVVVLLVFEQSWMNATFVACALFSSVAKYGETRNWRASRNERDIAGHNNLNYFILCGCWQMVILLEIPARNRIIKVNSFTLHGCDVIL